MKAVYTMNSTKWFFLPVFVLMQIAMAYAQEPYQPAGVVSNPVVEARWNYYRDYGQATELLREIAEAHPELCSLQSLGQSTGGREMWVMTITDFSTGDSDAKPGFWIDGNVHANEIQSADVVLYTAWYLTEMQAHSEFVRRLLAERVFYLLPMLSPDSRDAHFHEPNSSSSPRSGQIPIDDDRDGLFDEDPDDDLDGDGHITQMRKADPNGRWVEHPDYPNDLIRAEPDEPGQFLRLGSEGIDNDGDGMTNEDGDGYYDPNRDYAWHWQPGRIQRGAYRYPFSVRENRLAAEFVMAHPNIAGGQSFHNTGGMILRGPGDPEDSFPYDDIRVYDKIGQVGEEMLPGYAYTVTSEDLYAAYGTVKDWLYNMRGALSFTNEMNSSFNYFRRENEGDWMGSREDQLQFNDLLLFGEGYVDWQEYDHPVYGRIEIGGRKKTWGRQPPSFLLEEECHRNMAFVLYHADQLPLVEIQQATIRESGTGKWVVEATIVNRRLIPTRLRVDVERHITRPDHAYLLGDGFNVLASLWSDEQFFEYPREQWPRPEVAEIPRIAGNGVVYVRWFVSGIRPTGVAVSSVKGGADERAID
ncbi:MAG TPA: peptidase M14 [Firmicutes bacterium]|nr:peptidase M14 [Bacillota bacterium]